MPANVFRRRRSLLSRGLLLVVVVATFLHLPTSPATAEHDDGTPTASFVIEPQYPRSGKKAKFAAEAEAVGDAYILFYWWRFGDGTGGFGKEVLHTYDAPAEEVRVELVVLDSYWRKTVVHQHIPVVQGNNSHRDAKMAVERLYVPRWWQRITLSVMTGRYTVVTEQTHE